ncbi:MAG TPA: hypothetical protein H9869_06310 [Candidatus Ligilactobacillus excrementipullorum]|nr:hypothetical protein [Candidatus Ligilactobacillus excrementipullorum]
MERKNKLKQYSKWFRALNFLVTIMALLSLVTLFGKETTLQVVVAVLDGVIGTLYIITFVIETIRLQKKYKQK